MSTDADVLPLHGACCRSCGYISVPAQQFGCESCGAHGIDLTDFELRGRGTVLAAVRVYDRLVPCLGKPVVIGNVLLDQGPLLRARLEDGVQSGTAVRAVAGSMDDHPALVFAAVRRVAQ